MTVEALDDYGMDRMDDDAIDDFLSNQGAGVLGLSGDRGPYLVPLSFGYDGDSGLYFTYVVGSGSRKDRLTDPGDVARFLVYSAATPFNWESVLLTGTLERVPEAEWDAHEAARENAWQPDLFERASATEGVAVYRFQIEDRTGIRHTGLPPAFQKGER